MVEDHGYAPAQWVLGKNLRLPYSLLSQSGQLAAQMRLGADPTFAERVLLLATARRSVAALSANVGIARAFAAPSRGEASVPAITVYQVGDQVFYWRGVSKAKSAWAHRWHGPGVIIGLEQNEFVDKSPRRRRQCIISPCPTGAVRRARPLALHLREGQPR